MCCGFSFIQGTCEPRREKNRVFAYAKTKAQISFAVTAKLISAFVFATRIQQFLFYLNLKFQASSSFLSLYRPVCVGPGRKPRRPVFSRRGSCNTLFYRRNTGMVLSLDFRCRPIFSKFFVRLRLTVPSQHFFSIRIGHQYLSVNQ